MFESIATFFNTYPVLWLLYSVLITLPIAAVISFFLWPKKQDSPPALGQKKDDSSNHKVKDDVSVVDSGFEASGETEPSRPNSVETTTPPTTTTTTATSLLPSSLVGDEEREERDQKAEEDDNAAVVGDGLRGTEAAKPEGNAETTPRWENGTGGLQRNGLEKQQDRIEIETDGGVISEEGGMEDNYLQNGIETSLINGGEFSNGWRFPPVLEDFDLMESDADPSELEEIFADERLVEVRFKVEDQGPGVGISIVGGSGSPNGDLPIIIKRVLPDSLAEQDGQLKAGDEIVAVNDKLLIGVSKDSAISILSKMEGDVRILVLQDD